MTVDTTDTTTDTTTADTTTNATTTSAADAAAVEPLVADDAACPVEWVELGDRAGTITFARDGILFDVDPETGEFDCIADIAIAPTTLDWNPAGDHLLVGDTMVITAEQRTPIDLVDGTGRVTWSKPAGTALIAPGPDGSTLVHLDADRPTNSTDVGALAVTWAADYHPSGLAIVSAGIDDAGRPGLFLADNTGDRMQQLVALEDADTVVTEIVFSADGSAVTFVHDHTDGSIDEGVRSHVHRLVIGSPSVQDLASYADTVPSVLVSSEQDDGTVAWQSSEADSPLVVSRGSGERPAKVIMVGGGAVRPVGFVDEAVVAIASSEEGSTNVWRMPRSGDPVLIAHDVDAATSRTTPSANWLEPPLDIDLRAVG